MTPEDYREELREISGHETLVFLAEGHFDTAVIGVSLDGRVVYDTEAVIAALMQVEGLSEEDANEHFDYNIAGSYVDAGPVFISLVGYRPNR